MLSENGSEVIRIQSGLLVKSKYLGQEGCNSCIRQSVCQLHRLVESLLIDFNTSMLKKHTYHEGQEVFSVSDKHDGFYVVKSGMFESYIMNDEGEIQVIGFYMAGDFFGLEQSCRNNYHHYVKALDTSSVCKISFSTLEDCAIKNNKLMTSLLNLLGEVVSQNHEAIFSLSRMNAKRRFANFILDLWKRMTKSGFDGNNLKLYMSRTDIANYLGLSVETVSRLFTRFQDMQVLTVKRRLIQIDDIGLLCKIAHSNDNEAKLTC